MVYKVHTNVTQISHFTRINLTNCSKPIVLSLLQNLFEEAQVQSSFIRCARVRMKDSVRVFSTFQSAVTYIGVPLSSVDDWKTESDLVCFDEIIIVITHMGPDQLQLEARNTVSSVSSSCTFASNQSSHFRRSVVF